jgi:hypothetical protein
MTYEAFLRIGNTVQESTGAAGIAPGHEHAYGVETLD